MRHGEASYASSGFRCEKGRARSWRFPERTREKVLEAAKRLGSVYNRGAASLQADDRNVGQQTLGLGIKQPKEGS